MCRSELLERLPQPLAQCRSSHLLRSDWIEANHSPHSLRLVVFLDIIHLTIGYYRSRSRWLLVCLSGTPQLEDFDMQTSANLGLKFYRNRR